MIKPFLLLSILFCLCACGNKNDKQTTVAFNEFIFSRSALYENYSIKFTKSDTVFIEERFPEPTKRYYAIITDTLHRKLNFILDTLHLARFDTSYIEENLQDGASYKFYLQTDTLVKTISIYGDVAPKAIYPVAVWLDSLAKRITKHPTNGQVDFGELSGINPPPSPPPPGPND